MKWASSNFVQSLCLPRQSVHVRFQVIASSVLDLNDEHFMLDPFVVSALVVLLTFPLILLRNISKLAPTRCA